MEPATRVDRLGDDAAVTQDHDDWAQLAEYLRDPLLRSATAVLQALAELPDHRVNHELASLGLSTQINLTALTEHLTTANRELSLAEGVRRTLVAGLPVRGTSA